MGRPDLESSIKQKGKYVTQIIHFKDGVKRTFENINTENIKQGQFTKMKCIDGTMLMINDDNVLCIEIFKEN